MDPGTHFPVEYTSVTPPPMTSDRCFPEVASAESDLIMDEILSTNNSYWLEIEPSTPFSPLFDLTSTTETNNNSNNQEPELQSCWIQPSPAASSFIPLKERLSYALKQIKESQKDSDVLVQIWVPVESSGRKVLTTCGQPFWLDSNCQRLMSYRTVSVGYQFSAEIGSGEALGLPGRVFVGRLPEWSPDVRYFSRDEYPRVGHAQKYEIGGTIALPIFEKGSGNCLGVVEVVRTTQKINYSADLESICSVLQAVDLQSSDVRSVSCFKMNDDSYRAALPEIHRVLQVVCETHKLPLAQTWMPCFHHGKRGSRHSEENFRDCISTVDAACYVRDSSMLGFNEACSEHHLLRGQGVAGRAFTTNQPCFSPDITSFNKTIYPLSHHARMFDLRAAVAIRLRCIHTGMADFVLEFFLPINCIGNEEQKLMLNSLSATIQQVCQNLRVVTANELEDEARFRGSQLSDLVLDELCFNGGEDVSSNFIHPTQLSKMDIPVEGPSRISEAQQRKMSTLLPSGGLLELQMHEVGTKTNWGQQQFLSPSGKMSGTKYYFDELTEGTSDQKVSTTTDTSFLFAGKTAEKRRTKTEKTISLQVLRQYFAGSLKDAAKSLGVCPTTLKRICRQHGITRWPSRKIKKVGHSLRKLQVVIDSVRGAEGAFQFRSLYDNLQNTSGSSNLFIGDSTTSTKPDEQRNSSHSQQQLEAGVNSHTSASNSLSSSGSHSSNSSRCCSSGTKKSSSIEVSTIIKQENQMESQGELLKKVHGQLQMPHSGQETPITLTRSQSLEHTRDASRSLSPSEKSKSDLMRVKAMFREEKVRFRLQPTWSFNDLKQEIASRFNIGNINPVDLKYLDDDSEWVLLTCDADLQECIEVYKLSGTQTVKITVHHSSQRTSVSSLGHTSLS